MDKLYITVGVPGVGKSTLINRVVMETEIKIANFGNVITRLMKENGIDTTRDDLRSKTNQNTWIKYQTMTAQEIGKMQGTIILDTHAGIPSPRGYYPGLPPHVLNNFPIHPLIIFVVEANPETIYKRRMRDEIKNLRTRSHDFEAGVERIKEHQDIQRYLAAAYCANSGARLKIIKNNDGGLEQAIKEVRDNLLEV